MKPSIKIIFHLTKRNLKQTLATLKVVANRHHQEAKTLKNVVRAITKRVVVQAGTNIKMEKLTQLKDGGHQKIYLTA